MSHVPPRTPPKSGSPAGQERNAATTAIRAGGKATPSPNQPYNSGLSQGTGGWAHDHEGLDDDYYDEIVYDDDEDEFGLPSIASMRKKGKTSRKNDPAHKTSNSTSKNTLSLNYDPSSRPRANSSDIAEERGVSLYPSAKKSEGKILRPQYKDVLMGTFIRPFNITLSNS
jgi:hypothetical protein